MSNAIAEVVVGSSTYRLAPYRDAFEITRNSETLVIVCNIADGLRRLRGLAELLAPPLPCPVCCRLVCLTARRALANHNQQPSAPGRKGRRCPGSGLKPAGAT